MSFETAFTQTVGVEGGFSDDKNDPGGKTRFGVTEAEARAHGYAGDMRQLPFSFAKAVAKSQYWDLLRGDDISGKSQTIAEELFDTAYNMGVGTAGKFLQRALNVFNRQQRDYADLTVDGVIGPVTVFTLGKFLDVRKTGGERVMLNALNVQQGVRYIEIAEGKPTSEDFTYGWFLQRVRIA